MKRTRSNAPGFRMKISAFPFAMFLVNLLCALPEIGGADLVAAVEVGVARIDITPTHPVILAGYGGRVGEHDGVETPLWARALAIGAKNPVLLIAVDNCGAPASFTREVVKRLKVRADMDADRLVLCFTHTHSAPSLTGYAPVIWSGRASKGQIERADRYTRWLTDRLVKVAMAALDAREPATLEWGLGRVGFGGNRRLLRDGRWAGFGFQIDRPVDHSLPVLLARDRSGHPLALWTNYACHCTTLGSGNRICGDWAGCANDAIEENIPGVVALTTVGCGADVGPQPTGTLELARRHGTAVAVEIERLVDKEATLSFDVTWKPSRWTGEKGEIELLYVPTWTSDEDSGGFFFVTIPTARATRGKPLQLGVRSRGEASFRWFSVDYYMDAAAMARAILRP